MGNIVSIGKRITTILKPDTHTMAEGVAIMTGALNPDEHPAGAYPKT